MISLNDIVSALRPTRGRGRAGAPGAQGAAGATGGGGGLTLIENKIFTADATSYEFAGLDGNTDGTYVIEAELIGLIGSQIEYYLRPNSISTNMQSRRNLNYANLGDSTGDLSHLMLHWVYGHATDTYTPVGIVTAKLRAKCNANSVARVRSYAAVGGLKGTIYWGIFAAGGGWNETSTNITSLLVISPTANGIKSGSTIQLYKLAQ